MVRAFDVAVVTSATSDSDASPAEGFFSLLVLVAMVAGGRYLYRKSQAVMLWVYALMVWALDSPDPADALD